MGGAHGADQGQIHRVAVVAGIAVVVAEEDVGNIRRVPFGQYKIRVEIVVDNNIVVDDDDDDDDDGLPVQARGECAPV